MLIQRIQVLPDGPTLDYLSQIMSAASFKVELDAACVVLNYSQVALDPESLSPHEPYTAQAMDINIWYDPANERSSLIMLLESPQMAERAFELREVAPNPFHNQFYPHMVLVESMPPIRRRYRAQFSSWADTLLRDRMPLVFNAEMAEDLDMTAAPDMALYEDLNARFGRIERIPMI